MLQLSNQEKRSLAICALLEAPGWSTGLNISRKHFQTSFSWLNTVFWHGIVWQSSLWFLWAWELWHGRQNGIRIKSLKGHKSLGLLFNVEIKRCVISESVSQWQGHLLSCLWTAKNVILFSFQTVAMIKVGEVCSWWNWFTVSLLSVAAHHESPRKAFPSTKMHCRRFSMYYHPVNQDDPPR